MNKLYTITAILLIILIAAFGNWLIDEFKTLPLVPKQEVRHDPDYYLENFSATVLHAGGSPRYKLKASYLEHFPDDDSLELKQLNLQFYRDNLPPWHTRSDKGRILDKGNHIELLGEVIMWRDAGVSGEQKVQPVKLTTSNLTILTEKDYAETREQVLIESGVQRMKATGMRLYLSDGRLELLSRTEGYYQTQ